MEDKLINLCSHAPTQGQYDEKPRVSIVITAFNQHYNFLNSMASLAVQIENNPSIPVEIVIVDNGSEPALEDVFEPSLFEVPIHFIKRNAISHNFRPGSARNIGIGSTNGDFILFLDGDCIPGPVYLQSHWERMRMSAESVVTLGHRIFIDGVNVNPSMIREYQCDLRHIPEINSASNYGLARDRRLKEFEEFDNHPMPFHCCHGCNMGIRRIDLQNVGGFDEDFDGYWGYEDIEFAYRMWAQGAKINYLRPAYVYHQEERCTLASRLALGASRNYALACERIPGFSTFRDQLNRSYYHDLRTLE